MSYVTYTQTGPFVNNNPPGISAAFLNAVETFLVAGWFDSAITSNGSGILSATGLASGQSLLNLAPKTPQTKSGSTSGTMTLYEWMTGSTSLKIVLINFASYKNAAASANTFTLNTAFTVGAMTYCGDVGNMQFLASAAAQNITVIATLGSGGTGTTSTQTSIQKASLGECHSAFDSISELGSNANTHSGFMVVCGI